MVEALCQRFDQAKAAGDVTVIAEPADLARYVVTVMNGMSVQAASGAGPDVLRRVAKIALSGWPETASTDEWKF